MLVICNFTKDAVEYQVPDEFAGAQTLIGNYDRDKADGTIELKPYEALVLKK